MKQYLVGRYQICQPGGPGVQNGPGAEGLGSEYKIYLKIFIPHILKAQVRGIWYVAFAEVWSCSLRVQTDPTPGCPGLEL